jgi:hypothetical protein
MTNLILLLVGFGFAGLFLCELFFRYLPARRSRQAVDRVLWDESAEIAAQTQQMKRIAYALEVIAAQFPEDKPPYFERLLMTLQEWTPARR